MRGLRRSPPPTARSADPGAAREHQRPRGPGEERAEPSEVRLTADQVTEHRRSFANERGAAARPPPFQFPPLTRKPTRMPVMHRRFQPRRRFGRTDRVSALVASTPLRTTNVQRSGPPDHPPEVVIAPREPVRINRPRNGHLSDLANGGSALPCDESGLAPWQGRRDRCASVKDDRPAAGLTPGGTGMDRDARRHDAGERPALARDLIRGARPLHSPHSADSRSRPKRPSRHIRDAGPDGVRERRAPLTGVRYPLCYLGTSRARGPSVDERAPLSPSSVPP